MNGGSAMEFNEKLKEFRKYGAIYQEHILVHGHLQSTGLFIYLENSLITCRWHLFFG